MRTYDQILDQLVALKAVLSHLFEEGSDQQNFRIYLHQLGRLSVLSELMGTGDAICSMGKKNQASAIGLAREISELLDSDRNPYNLDEPKTLIEALERTRVSAA